MTLRELSQLSSLKKEEAELRQQIHDLKSDLKECTVVDTVQSSGTEPPYQQHTQVVKGIGPSGKAMALSDMIGQRKVRLGEILIQRAAELERLEQYIAGIPDSLTRRIFTYRFAEGKTWQQVAAKVGPPNTIDGIKKICYRYLESCPQCPEQA